MTAYRGKDETRRVNVDIQEHGRLIRYMGMAQS